MTEKELIEGLKRKDEAAFKAFVNQYKDLVYRLCYSIIQNRDDADDLAQEVFIKVYNSISGFRSDAKISTWLYRITLNMAINYVNSKKRKSLILFLDNVLYKQEKESPSFEILEKETEQEKKYRIMYKTLQQLPDNQRKAFILHHQEGLSYYEIAEVLDLSHSAIESLIHRAKTGLRKKMIKELKKQNLFES